MIKPIRPEELSKNIPTDIIEIFNELIQQEWNGSSAIILQKEAVNEITSRLNYTDDQLFKKKYLDIEDLYRKAGWKVTFDQPGYCETGEAYWKFSK